MKHFVFLVAFIFFALNYAMSCNPSGPNIIINGDFSQGNYGFSSSYTYTNSQNGLNPDGYFAVGSDIIYFHSGAAGSFYDHTVGTAAGSYLMLNGSTIANAVLWSQTVAVTPNTDYEFSMWNTNWSSDNINNFALFKILVNGIAIGTDTGVQANFIWQQITASWNSQSDTSATISIIDLTLDGYGNDFGIDDISFRSCALAPISKFQSSDSIFCDNHACISFYDLSLNNPTGWEWLFSGAFPDTSTLQNPVNVCYQQAGEYSVTLITGNSAGTDTITLHNYIKVNPAPPDPDIHHINDTTLYCNSNLAYTSYQWYYDSVLVSGATDTTLFIHQSGNYNVQVTNEAGCSIAAGINVVLSGIEDFSKNNGITIYPNPAINELFVNCITCSGKETLKIYNILGKVCDQYEIINPISGIKISSLSPGVYFLKMNTNNGLFVYSFIKE